MDVFVRPISDANRRKGWAIASYLVAHAAARWSSTHIIFDERIWSGRRSSEDGLAGLRPAARRRTASERAILEHRDHVHVDVVEGELTERTTPDPTVRSDLP